VNDTWFMPIIQTKCVNWFVGNPVYYDCLKIFGIDYQAHILFIISGLILSLILFVILYFINRQNKKIPLRNNLLLSIIVFILSLIIFYSYAAWRFNHVVISLT